MVRLVVLSLVLLLSGCSLQSTRPVEPEALSDIVGSEHPAVVALMQDAGDSVADGNWRKALSFLEQARRIEPRNPYILMRQAEAYDVLGEKGTAGSLLQRARLFASGDERAEQAIRLLETRLQSGQPPVY